MRSFPVAISYSRTARPVSVSPVSTVVRSTRAKLPRTGPVVEFPRLTWCALAGWLAGLLVALFLATSGAFAQEATIDLEHGKFRARVAIGNHSGKVMVGPAVLDTGASVVFVCEQALALANIHVPTDAKPASMQDATGRVSMARQMYLAFVDVGPVRVENVLAVVTPGPCKVPVLIGLSWLTRIKSLEMNARQITLRQ